MLVAIQYWGDTSNSAANAAIIVMVFALDLEIQSVCLLVEVEVR